MNPYFYNVRVRRTPPSRILILWIINDFYRFQAICKSPSLKSFNVDFGQYYALENVKSDYIASFPHKQGCYSILTSMKERFWLMTLNSLSLLSFTYILPSFYKLRLMFLYSNNITLKILANILKLLEFGTWTILIHINNISNNNNNKTKKNSFKRLSDQGRNRSVRESIWCQNGHFHRFFFFLYDCIVLK